MNVILNIHNAIIPAPIYVYRRFHGSFVLRRINPRLNMDRIGYLMFKIWNDPPLYELCGRIENNENIICWLWHQAFAKALKAAATALLMSVSVAPVVSGVAVVTAPAIVDVVSDAVKFRPSVVTTSLANV